MSGARGQPNIVLLITDTQGREMVSSYVDRPGVATPNIDRLSTQGVLFENAFTTCPLCTPARSSLYTGLYPSRNGAFANELAVMRHVPMLGEVLRDRGYQTFHVGKWHLDAAGYSGGGRADAGFDPAAWYDLTNFYDEVGRAGINRFGGWNKGLHDIEYCFAHRVADRSIDILRRQRDYPSPFFLAVSFDEPHGPYICPPPFRGQSAKTGIYVPPTLNAPLECKPRIQQEYAAFLAAHRENPATLPAYYYRYYDCNAYVDYEIGRVLEAIERLCSEDTVIIYTSDHGDHLGAFGLMAKGPTMYDHTIAVPLIIRLPQPGASGWRSSALVSLVDVWATILDLGGVFRDGSNGVSKAGYSGRSLLPILHGVQTAVRDAVYVEYNRFAIDRHQTDGFFPIRCIRTADWKLSINLFDRDELYDLRSDPEEVRNLIDEPSYRSIRDHLHDRLLQCQDAALDVFRGPCWGRRPWRGDYSHQFEGFFTTGWRDLWEGEPFQ